MFFAWETRNVKIQALNDSKLIGVCVYNVVVMSLVSVVLANLLPVDQVNVSYGVSSVAILFSAGMTLTLVFGLKVNAHTCPQ